MADSPTRSISVRLPESDALKLEQLASDDDRSITNYVKRVLQAHIEETSAK